MWVQDRRCSAPASGRYGGESMYKGTHGIAHVGHDAVAFKPHHVGVPKGV
jgi:hypothetical protein